MPPVLPTPPLSNNTPNVIKNKIETGNNQRFISSRFSVIYLFYTGLSAWIICYVRKKGKAVYKGENLFLLRQYASKLKTMRFTMGTLTSLFTIAFLGCTAAMMFSDYQQQVLNNKFPFDVQIYNREAGYDFQKELSLLHEETDVKESYTYRIYTDGTNEVNTWLYTHLKYFGTIYKNEDGTPNEKKIRYYNDIVSSVMSVLGKGFCPVSGKAKRFSFIYLLADR